MSTFESYFGQNAIISYIRKQKNKASYWGFLKNYHKIIVTSIFSDNTTFSDDWNELNNTWIAHFINEGKIIPGFKDKKKENQVSSHQEEYEKEKENQVTAIASHSKRIIKIPVKDKNIKLINFCYNILQELDKKSNTHPFYKYDEKEISNKIIKNPMDLFTIILKLEHDQYTNTEEFEKDIHLIFCNCYIYNDVGIKQKEKLKRARDNNSDSSEQNKDKLVYRQVVNDATLIVSAYENTVSGNIIPFIEILKTFLSTRSQMSLFSADEAVLQAIVESLLPLKYCIPKLSIGIGNNNVSLELKYISLVGLIKNQKKKFNTNELENLDKIIEKEDETVLLKRLYTYWSKEHNETRQTTIKDILNNGVNQLKSYMNIISKGKTIDYYSSGIFDKRIKITKSNSNKLEGFVILGLNISVNKGCIASGINCIFTQLPTGFLLNTTYPGIPVLFKNQQGKQLQNTINDST
ncbi:hypothetical protein RhiirA5_428214 [Rhizophagus irregularis]|uniref:Bromo domain-containing protein n=1 Tax=Rhizophagus irregularis TaxID=588596 RepID=A0A2N0P0T1_9GLOM|nr:hypothetical protein RhiirA5_428214 [Rhizophagus irregularis]